MKKQLLKVFCALIAGMVALFSVGCTFFDSEETRTIENIYSRRSADDTGMEVVIEYTGDYPDSTFFIPDPAAGEEGNGIRSIGATTNEDGSVTVTVEYTDVSLPPYVFSIPCGRYITDISSETDPETNIVTVTVSYSDGSDPAVFTLLPGRDGIDGDKISRIEWNENEETGDIEVHVFYLRFNAAEGTWEEYELEDSTITIPRGRGIEEIRCEDDTSEDSFTLRVFFSDGGSQELKIGRVNRWFVGEGQPGGSSYHVGDFYFDSAAYRIYHKIDALEWEIIADFSRFVLQYHTVTFHTSDGIYLPVRIEHGYNFASSEDLTIPQAEPREGFRFLGWYTKPVGDGEEPDPNSGHFTDLTPVLSDLDLYPRWEPIL